MGTTGTPLQKLVPVPVSDVPLLKLEKLNELLLQLDNAYSTYTSNRELVRSFIDTIVPQAEASLKMSKQGYEHGKFDFLEVMDAQRTLVTANFSYLRVLNDLFTSMTEIERLVGVKISDIK